MNELFATLKRFFEPRPRPAESVGEPTADRPPPPVAEAPRAEVPLREEPPRAEVPPRAESPPVDAAPSRDAASLHEDDLAEVRAALEAVAEAPVEADEPEAEAPVTADEPEAEALVTDELEAAVVDVALALDLDELAGVEFQPHDVDVLKHLRADLARDVLQQQIEELATVPARPQILACAEEKAPAGRAGVEIGDA